MAATRKNPDSRGRLSQDGKGHSPHPSGSDQGYPGLPTALRPEDRIVISGLGTKLVEEGDSLKDPGDLRSETEERGPPDCSHHSNRNSGMSWGIPPPPAVLSLWTISCFPVLSAYRTQGVATRRIRDVHRQASKDVSAGLGNNPAGNERDDGSWWREIPSQSSAWQTKCTM